MWEAEMQVFTTQFITKKKDKEKEKGKKIGRAHV